jgi:hypothetical protein
MDFDFFFKMVCTISFAGVTLCLCIKWIVESYLDYLQVTTGIKIATLSQLKDMQQEEQEIDDDPTAY